MTSTEKAKGGEDGKDAESRDRTAPLLSLDHPPHPVTTEPLRGGFTTGSCAAAAAKAAVQAWGGVHVSSVEIPLPDGTRAELPVESCAPGLASVRKDAGDDPDVTHRALISATVEPATSGGIRFAAGPGVGTVTLPGLQVPPGEPAINPVPRQQITAALAEAGCHHALVTISVANGIELAARTFNGRLGIVGGISILGTSGRVRAFSHPAIADTIRASIDVAVATGLRSLVLVPGHHGHRAVHTRFTLGAQQVIEVADAWGEAVDHAARQPFAAVLAAGHPSKLMKLALGQWNTHVSAGAAPVALLRGWAADLGLTTPETPTIDGVFTSQEVDGRSKLAELVANRVLAALRPRLPGIALGVLLTDMSGGCFGHAGDLSPWERS
jgi:cobalt-precorrin-5B (C1)-methyltransferase